jgi:hypothetical protein
MSVGKTRTSGEAGEALRVGMPRGVGWTQIKFQLKDLKSTMVALEPAVSICGTRSSETPYLVARLMGISCSTMILYATVCVRMLHIFTLPSLEAGVLIASISLAPDGGPSPSPSSCACRSAFHHRMSLLSYRSTTPHTKSLSTPTHLAHLWISISSSGESSPRMSREW